MPPKVQTTAAKPAPSPETGARQLAGKAARPRRAPKPPHFYQMGANLVGVCGWKLVNVAELQENVPWGFAPVHPWPDGYLEMSRTPWRFPDYLQPPKFVIAKKYGRPPHDLEEIDPYWIVSDAMRGVLEQVDPDSVEFRPCETALLSGEPGPRYWLCTIKRALFGVVDLEKSFRIENHPGENGRPGLVSFVNSKFVFRPEIVGDAHLFRIAEMGGRIFCDQVLKDACKAAGLTGIRFKDRS